MLPDQALNGAQVTSLVEVIERVALGTLPKASAKAIIRAAFNLDESIVNAIIDPIEEGGIDPSETSVAGGNVTKAAAQEAS